MNFQPVVPIRLDDEWDVISHSILPVIDQHDVAGLSGDQFGLGDTTQSFFLSSRASGPDGLVWGLGPALLIPTGTDEFLGSGKWGAGPTALALVQTHGWTMSMLTNQIWSVAGQSGRPDVSVALLQPFVACTMPTATTVTVNSETNYDWDGNAWSVPVKLMVSQIVKLGSQPVSLQAGLRYWADSLATGPEQDSLGFRFTVTFLFPEQRPPALTAAARAASVPVHDGRGTMGVMLVTGGSRGIGAAIAAMAGARGWSVAVNHSRWPERADRVCATICAAGGEAVPVRADMADEAAIVAMFEEVDRRFGRLDALVNNAGIDGLIAPFTEQTGAAMAHVMAVNAIAPMICAREVVLRMARSRGGAGGTIVNVSSRAAVHGRLTDEIPYAASKGAVDSFTIGLAHAVAGDGIRVNGVRPGLIATEMFDALGGQDAIDRMVRGTVPMNHRAGEPREIAGAVLWLCSEEASYTTDAILDVGGGR